MQRASVQSCRKVLIYMKIQMNDLIKRSDWANTKTIVVSEFEIPDDTLVKNETDIFNILSECVYANVLSVENMWVFVVDSSQKPVRFMQVAKMNDQKCNFSIKSIISFLANTGGRRFYVIHNHPGGDEFCYHSDCDIDMVESIMLIAKKLKLEFVDSVVLTENMASGYYSEV